MGRTLPTAPTNWPTSTRLPDHWTSSQDGARRPAFVTIVRSQRPVTAGRTGSWATRGIDSRHVVTLITQERSMLPSEPRHADKGRIAPGLRRAEEGVVIPYPTRAARFKRL